jgi:outer membrane protein insertion porin family
MIASINNRSLKILICVVSLTLIAVNCTLLYAQDMDVVRVRKVEFSGNEHFSNGNLRSLMEVRSKSLFERLQFWRRSPVYVAGLLEDDLARIVRSYQREGFLNAAIEEYEVEFDDNQQWVTISINIDEGKRVMVNDLRYRFIDAESEDFQEEPSRIRKHLNIREGHYFTDEEFQEDLITVRKHFDNLGYPHVRVNYDLSLYSSEDRVDIIYLVDPGPKAYFGEITFSGLRKIEERQLMRFLTTRTGEAYVPRRLDQTRNRLQDLAMFQFVSVSLRLDSRREIVPVEINLREQDATRLDFGVGFSIEDVSLSDLSFSDFTLEKNIRVYAEITRLRFLGGLRKATLFVKHSYHEPIILDFRLNQPGFPTVHSNLLLNPFYRREREPGYKIERIGGSSTINYRVSSHTGTYLTYTFENNRLLASAEFLEQQLNLPPGPSPTTEFFEEQNLAKLRDESGRIEEDPLRIYRKSSVTWGIVRDSSRPRFFPTIGSLLSSTVTFSGLGFGSDFQYLRVIGDARHYDQLRGDLVFAGRVRGGIIKDLSADNYIPIEERFYAGGSFSVRGWPRRQLGPQSEDGQPLGGNALLEGSGEFRFPLFGPLSGVSFLDFGNVWPDTWDHDLDDLRYSAGGGLRFATPVGPFRLDIATPIFEGRKPVQFFISLGQAF